MPRSSNDTGPLTSNADAIKAATQALQSLNSLGPQLVRMIPGIQNSSSAFASVSASSEVATKSILAVNRSIFSFSGVMSKIGEVFKPVSDTAGKAVDYLYRFVKAQNDLIAGISAFSAGASRAGASLLRMPLDVLDSTISAIQINVARFVKLAQPGAFQLFERAVDDLYAVIGRQLIPVLQTATQFLRSIGGALAGLNVDGQKTIQMIAAGTTGMIAFAAAATLVTTVMSGGLLPLFSALIGGMSGLLVVSGNFKPIFDEMSKIIGGVLNEVGKAFTALMPVAQPFLSFFGELGNILASTVSFYSTLFTSLAPEFGALTASLNAIKDAVLQVIRAMAGIQLQLIASAISAVAAVMAQAAPYIAAFVKVMGDLVSNVIRWIAGLFGISLPNLSAPPQGRQQNNVGAAAARSTSTGDPSDVLKRARESAFQLGFGGKKPEDHTADNTKAIATAMQQTQAKIDTIIRDIEQFPGQVAKFIYDGAKQVVDGLRAVTGSVASGAAGAASAGISTAIDPSRGPIQKVIEGQLDRFLGGLINQ